VTVSFVLLLHENKHDDHSLSPNAQAAIRVQAVAAVQDDMPKSKAATVFRSLVPLFTTGCPITKRAATRDCSHKLGLKNKVVKRQVCNIIRDRHTGQIKLLFALWDACSMRDLIKDASTGRYSRYIMCEYCSNAGSLLLRSPSKPPKLYILQINLEYFNQQCSASAMSEVIQALPRREMIHDFTQTLPKATHYSFATSAQ